MKHDHRRHDRHWPKQPRTLRVRFSGETGEGSGHVSNLSEGGVFVRSVDLPTPGSRVRVSINPVRGKAVEITGRVAWTTELAANAFETVPGFGVQIDGDAAAYADFLESLLDDPSGS